MIWRDRKFDWIGLGGHVLWLIFWTTAVFIWGYWKWRTIEFGSPEWWFDNIAHILLPFAGSVNLIYEINYFRPTALFTSTIKRAFLLWSAVPLVIICLAIAWEGGEAYHDARPFTIIQAQKGDPDTTVDILLAIPSSYFGVWIYTLFSSYRMRRNPKRALVARTAEYFARRRAWKQEKRELFAMKREIIILRRKQTRELPPLIFYRKWIPNAITIFRLVLVIPLFFAVSAHPYSALFIIFLAGLSDLFDGILARLLGSRNRWGARLDPLADKVFYFVGLIAMRQFIPSPFFYFLMVGNITEVFLMGIRFVPGYTPEANWFGKVKAFCWFSSLTLLMSGIMLNSQNIRFAGILLACVAVPLSWGSIYRHLSNR